jgi:hypothetical protein
MIVQGEMVLHDTVTYSGAAHGDVLINVLMSAS